MDYQQELAKLEQQESSVASEFWKPVAGKYKVRALGELEDGKPYVDKNNPSAEPQPRKQLRIQLEDGKVVTFSMPHGLTPASTYGQLVKLGVERKALINQEFTIAVVGSGQNKRFTIV